MQGHPGRIRAKFNHVASADKPKPRRGKPHTAYNHQIPPPLSHRGVVRLPVEGIALHRPDIFRPLAFNVNQGPLPPTESKMLNPGNQEVVILGKHNGRPLESLRFRSRNPQTCGEARHLPFCLPLRHRIAGEPAHCQAPCRV